MNKSVAILLVLLSFSCANDKQQFSTSKDIAKMEVQKTTSITNNVTTITDELYTLQFKIEKTKKNQHNLVIDMKLHKGSSFISPFEIKEFKGKFYMNLGSYKDLSFDGNIIETPRAVARYDGFEDASIIWVKENTKYMQPLNILSEDDFEVFGRLKFTIEPRCSLEEIPFAISYIDGKMTFFEPKC